MNLAQIRLEHSLKLSTEDLEALNALLNTTDSDVLTFKDENYFKPSKNTEGFIEGDEKNNLALQQKSYLAYMEQPVRDVPTQWATYTVDIQSMLERFPTVQFKVEKVIKIKGSDLAYNLTSALSRIEDVQDRADKTLKNLSQFNEKVNVHVGNSLLMTINETVVNTDCCTEELDGKLNKGWRILAVCVQPDQRRPDYVLGRFNPDKII